MQATVVIAPKRNRKDQRPYDAELYKERNIIERFFSKLKPFRRFCCNGWPQQPCHRSGKLC
jgi:putative transposase